MLGKVLTQSSISELLLVWLLTPGTTLLRLLGVLCGIVEVSSVIWSSKSLLARRNLVRFSLHPLEHIIINRLMSTLLGFGSALLGDVELLIAARPIGGFVLDRLLLLPHERPAHGIVSVLFERVNQLTCILTLLQA